MILGGVEENTLLNDIDQLLTPLLASLCVAHICTCLPGRAGLQEACTTLPAYILFSLLSCELSQQSPQSRHSRQLSCL